MSVSTSSEVHEVINAVTHPSKLDGHKDGRFVVSGVQNRTGKTPSHIGRCRLRTSMRLRMADTGLIDECRVSMNLLFWRKSSTASPSTGKARSIPRPLMEKLCSQRGS